MKTRFAAAAAALLFSSAIIAPVSAGTLFTTGPGVSDIGYTINGEFAPFSISASFTLDKAATITGFTFAGVTDTNRSITSVSYNISSSSTGATTATTDLTKSGLLAQTSSSYDVRDYTGSTAATVLKAGTYWLTLGSAEAGGGSGAYWNINNNTVSKADQYLAGTYFSSPPGLSFSILGNAGVPEPATWALMILGFGAVGGAMRRRQLVAAKVRFA